MLCLERMDCGRSERLSTLAPEALSAAIFRSSCQVVIAVPTGSPPFVPWANAFLTQASC